MCHSTEIKYYHFREGGVDGVPAILSRTGYTGEDGFEVYAAADKAEQLWNKMLDAGNFGADDGVLPCGLAARNTLRLEAGMCSLRSRDRRDDHFAGSQSGLDLQTATRVILSAANGLTKQKEAGLHAG